MSKKVWCKDITWNEAENTWAVQHQMRYAQIPDSWDICPVAGCHKPRPKEVSLREQLIQKLNQEYLRFVKAWEYEGGQYPSCGYLIPKLVDICLEFLKGKI